MKNSISKYLSLVIFICLITLFSTSTTFASSNIHVATMGSDSIGDGSPDHPYASIQFAIHQARIGDQVLIQEGIYIPPSSIELGYEVTIKGGYDSNWNFTGNAMLTIIEGNGDKTVFKGSNLVGRIECLTIQGGNGMGNDNEGDGGGLAITDSYIELNNLIIQTCSAYAGGAVCLMGGGNLDIDNCIFQNNTAQYGHVLYSTTPTTINNSTFLYNGSMEHDKVIYFGAPSTTSNSIFHDNSSEYNLIGTEYDFLNTFTNCLFYNNNSNSAILSRSIGENGSLDLFHCTITNNNCSVTVVNYDGNLNINNSIIHNEDSYMEVQNASSGAIPTITYSNIRGGYAGEGNIDANPQFTNRYYHDYTLSDNSPCLQAGEHNSLTNDLANNPRPLPIGTNPDMGAYESDHCMSDSLEMSIDLVPPSCHDSKDGKATLSINGGCEPYTFSHYDHHSGTWEILNITPGTYSDLEPFTSILKVEDAAGQTDIDTVIMTAPLAIKVRTTNEVAPTCIDSQDGHVEIVATGGVSPYMYSKDGENYQSSPVFNNIGRNLQKVFVKDVNECTVEGIINFGRPKYFYVKAKLVSCQTRSIDRCVQVRAGGGDGAYEYSIDEGQNWQYDNMFYKLSPGEYTIWVRDGNGCQTYTTITISPIKLINLSINPNPARERVQIAIKNVTPYTSGTLQIRDQKGRIVLEKNKIQVEHNSYFLHLELDQYQFRTGLYFVSFINHTDGAISTQKLMINQ